MRFSRTSIAAAATIAALGILAAVALASGGEQPTTAPAPAAETDPPAQVRTETVRRTVHRDAPARTASSDDDGTADQGPGDAPPVPGDEVKWVRTPVAPAHDANDDRGGDRGEDFDDDRGGHGDNSGPGSTSRGGDDDGGHSGRGGGGDDD